MNTYPKCMSSDPQALKDWVDNVQRQRVQDIADFNALPQRFVGGRRVSKAPASSTDLTGYTVGDFYADANYAYFCINNAGTPKWLRCALGSF